MKKIFIAITLFSASLNSTETDLLLDKLVEKGIINGYEASEIKINGEEETKMQISNRLHRTLPLWLQSIKIGSDLRLRHEEVDDDSVKYIRSRNRIKASFYINSKINDRVYGYLGFATGEDQSPKSKNQTLTGNFSKKEIYLDYAYLEYCPFHYLTFLGGKMKNPVWDSNNMLWDSDINPEGFFLRFEKNFNSNFLSRLSAGELILNEIKNKSNDPYAVLSNIYLNLTDTEKIYEFKNSITYYDFQNIKNSSLMPWSAKTNSTALPSTSTYKNDYNILSFDAQLAYNLRNPLKTYLVPLSINYLSINASYVKNVAIAKKNKGYLIGFKIGNSEVKNAGDFQLSYDYRKIEIDGWLDSYPDSDFHAGETGVYGSKYAFVLGLAENFNLTTTYFNTNSLITSKEKEKVLQIDLNIKL